MSEELERNQDVKYCPKCGEIIHHIPEGYDECEYYECSSTKCDWDCFPNELENELNSKEDYK